MTVSLLHADQDLMENHILGKGDFKLIPARDYSPVVRSIPKSTEMFVGLNVAL